MSIEEGGGNKMIQAHSLGYVIYTRIRDDSRNGIICDHIVQYRLLVPRIYKQLGSCMQPLKSFSSS